MINGNFDIVIVEVAFYVVVIGGFYCWMRIYDWRQSKKKAQEVS